MSDFLQLLQFSNHGGQILRGILSPANSLQATICLHGFGHSTIEKKFTNLENKFRGKQVFLRFDHRDSGLSDGHLQDFTVQALVEELDLAVQALRKAQPQVEQINLVAHSLGACVALTHAVGHGQQINKLVFLAPAFNQRQLLRYWYARKVNPEEQVDWQNYQQHFDEKKFQKFVDEPQKQIAQYCLGTNYHQENQDQDYQALLKEIDLEKILIIHADNDEQVPIESNHQLPAKIRVIKVKDGSHHLEKPAMVEQYLPEVVEFLSYNSHTI